MCKRVLPFAFVLVLALTCVEFDVGAAEIVWFDLIPVDLPLLDGAVVEAINCGGPAVADVGGVDFLAGDASADPPQHSNLFDHLTSSWAGPSGAADLVADPGLGQVVTSGRWISGTAAENLELTNLTPGTRYRIQLYPGDQRACCSTRGYHFEDELGNASPVWTRGGMMSLVGEFVAESDTQVMTMFVEDGSSDPLINGYVLSIATIPNVARDPSPAEGAADVPRDVTLAWTAGESAVTHDVYLGTVFDDVNNASRSNPLDVLVSQGQAETMYEPPAVLEFGQTYYWRVDEVNGAPDNTIFEGEIWSFTVEPFAYPIANVMATSNGTSDAGVGPERTVDGSGLNENDEHSTVADDMWLAVPGADPLQVQYEFDGVYKLHEMLVWNYNVQFELMLGFGLKGVTVEYSEHGADWTALGDVTLNQATAKADYAANTAVAFGGVAAQYVRLTVNSGYGPMGQFGLSEVRFMFIPVQAREPQPADGATEVLVGTTLDWRAGREAVSHDVYLGADPEALALADSVGEASYAPSDLQFGATVHWQIVEVNEAEPISAWASDVWSFATQEYAVIDDMESYDDEENRIFDAWLDGFVNGTGATVGYFEAPFAEKTIVNSGAQSMPLEYNNADAPFYSEAELDLGSANRETNGADTLRLFVSGLAPAFSETADGTILMNAIGTDIWGNNDEFRFVYKQLNGNGSITARVEALDGSPNSWAKGGVMIRQSTDIGSQHAFTALTGGSGGGAAFQRRIDENGPSTSNHDLPGGPFAPPYWVRIERAGNAFTSFLSADGQAWVQAGDTLTIEMDAAVLIGLAVTSHNTGQATSAAFANVSTTGNVTGSWEIAEIGVAQPTGNDIAPLYVALEDTSGNVAVVTHPDANVVGKSGWNEWLISYSDLAGVNLDRVAIMYIGVGDRDNPTAGGTGLVFIDDIGYGHPAPVGE